MRPIRLLASIAFLFSLTFALPAASQAPETKKDLLESDFGDLISYARAAYDAEDYETAIEGLTLANRRDPNSRLLLNIARSYERSGDCRTSLAYYEAFSRHPTADESLLESTRETLDELSPECSSYSDDMGGRLSLESEPLLATVSINGRQVGTTPMELAGLAPGSHTLEFSLEGYEVIVEEIEIITHEDLTITPLLEPLPDEPEPEPEPIAEPPSVSEAEPALNYAALGILGGGVALAATGAVFDLVLIPQTDEARQGLDLVDDAAEYNDLTDKRKTQATTALVGYIGGGVLIAGGAGWLIYDYVTADTQAEETPAWTLAPAINSEGFGFQFLGRF